MYHRPHVGESLYMKCPGESRDRRQAGGCQGLGEEWGVTVNGDGFPLGDEMFWNWAEVLVTQYCECSMPLKCSRKNGELNVMGMSPQ